MDSAGTPPVAAPARGLSAAQARDRLAHYGPNEIPDAGHRGLRRTLVDVATEPMFGLLLVAAAIYLAIGDIGEGLLLAFFALVTVGLVVIQQRRSERALDALRELAAPQARVVRDGEPRRIAARELVPGDLLVLGEGDRIAADALLREAEALAVDESLLTGESVPVRKRPDDGAASAAPVAVPGGDDTPFVHAGTLVVAGHGIAEVLATGPRTRMGRIGASLGAIEAAPTPLERQLRRVVRGFGALAFGLSGALLLWHGLTRGDWLQGMLAAIAVGMAMLPEEFPMVLAVFLALGAWRLARVHVLARRPAVIEALGAATVLAVDKTGTLTENRLRLRRLAADDGEIDLDGAIGLAPAATALLESAALASRRGGADPIDRAVLECRDRVAPASATPARLERLDRPLREYPLTPERLLFAQAWPGDEGGLRLAAKGAPEAVAALCRLPAAQRGAWLARARALADQGLRVLAVARAASAGAPAPDAAGYAWTWQGLLAFEDPLRPSVPAAVVEARRAGVAVVMITGDHAATALAIARAAGLEVQAGALEGEEIARLDDAALAAAVRRVRVFARVTPQQKLRLVQAFIAAGRPSR